MKTEIEISELAKKRYGDNPHSFGGQRDGFIEGYKQAQNEQLKLCEVVRQSEQLCRFFYAKNNTTSATKCEICGKESWEH